VTTVPAALAAAASDFDAGRIPLPVLVALAVAVAGWLLLLAALAVTTRPRAVRPAPGTLDLPAEPPAVVNLLAGGWRMTTDAMSATLLDLAAREVIDLEQVGAEPERTVCRLRTHWQPGELTAYERRVYDRVAGLSVGGIVPAAALQRGSPAQAARWWRGFRREVIQDAQRRGLSRNRWSRGTQVVLNVAALAPAVAAAAAFGWGNRSAGDHDGVLAVGAAVWAAFVLLPRSMNGQRDTPAGRAAAARWLGLRDYLGRDEAFDALPPAAVAIWDRYLGYAAALGVAGTASRVPAFGAEDERLVRSAYGGTWHPIRIRYPGRRLVEGRHPLVAALVGAAAMAAAYAGARQFLAELSGWALAGSVLAAVGLGGWGAYTVGRAVLDLAGRRDIEGEVLRVRTLRSGDRVTGYEVAIDDGRHPTVRAWPVPPGRMPSIGERDIVAASVGPRLRYVYRIAVTGRAAPPAGVGEPEPEPEPPGAFAPLVALDGGLGAATGDGPDPATLLTADEVSAAFGRHFGPARALTSEHAPPFLGMRMCEYAGTGPDRARVQVQTVTGRIARAMLERVRGEPLPGIGEEAFLRGDAVAVLQGDAGIAIRAQHVDHATARAALIQLATTAAGRLPAPRQPA
jgi:Predicted membrane protein (DUF2207)